MAQSDGGKDDGHGLSEDDLIDPDVIAGSCPTGWEYTGICEVEEGVEDYRFESEDEDMILTVSQEPVEDDGTGDLTYYAAARMPPNTVEPYLVIRPSGMHSAGVKQAMCGMAMLVSE